MFRFSDLFTDKDQIRQVRDYANFSRRSGEVILIPCTLLGTGNPPGLIANLGGPELVLGPSDQKIYIFQGCYILRYTALG
jgi:hypothetical protein